MQSFNTEPVFDSYLAVALITLCLSALATIYPAWRASRTLPAEALRHD